MSLDIYNHLEQLSDDQIHCLFKDDTVVLCLFRNLPPLAQHIFLRALYVNKNMNKNMLADYSMTRGSGAILNEALKTIRDLRIIKLEPKPMGDGRRSGNYRVNYN